MSNFKWILVAGAALSVSFVVESPYMAYTIYAFVLLVGIAHYSSLAWVSGLDCERTLDGSVVLQGESVEVDVTVRNERGWPIPWIFFEDLIPKSCHLLGDNTRLAVLMPGRSISLNYRLTFAERGYHRVGPLIMESGDLFGLQRRFRTGAQQDYVSVLPTVAYIDTFSISSRRPQGPVRISNRSYEDPTRIVGVREYVTGDPLNRIHWKASARTGQLYTKTYEPSSVMGGTLVLDLHGDSYRPEEASLRMELAITVTASIAYLLQVSGEQVGLLTNAFDAAEVAKYEVESQERFSRDEVEESVVGEGVSDRIRPLLVPTVKTPMQSSIISENLARVLPGKGLDVSALLLAEFQGLPRDAALLVVTPQITERLVLTLAEMKISGFAVNVFLIRDPHGYEEGAGALLAHNIRTFHIESEWDLHQLSPAHIGH